MSENKRIVISLPQNLLEEFDEIVECKSSRNRSKFIEEAVILYIKEQKSVKMNELMKRGYLEMAKINCEIAEFGVSCDCQELLKYEAELAESDVINGTGGEERRYFLC